jgi:hypothetical protein
MSDGIFISNRPQLAIARQSASFASLGLNDPTLTRSITKIGSPFLSYYPTDEYNAIEGVEEGSSYLLYVNKFFDGSPVLVNAVLDNLIPQTTTNVFAGEPTVFICTTSVDFVTAGITTLNTTLIVLVDEGYFVSYDPTDSENGISGFVEGSLYYIDPILDMDLSDWGVTEVRYADEVLYLNDLEDVVVTNTNPDATLPLDQEEILVRNATTGVWENIPYNPGTPVEDIPNGLISGGIVTWESGLTFRVTAAVYYIDGVRYESLEQTITLDAADATNPRFDVLVLDDSEAFDKITGVAAADPSEPQVDQSTQLYLTTVLVGAGATTPTGVSTVIVYDENTEWTASSAGTVSVNFNNTTNPSNGTKSAAVASWSAGATLVFTNSTTVNTGDVNSFSLRVWLTANLSKSQNLSIQFFNGATAVSLQQPIAISKTTTGAYQTFSLAEIDWTGAVFDRVKILLGGNNSNVLYIDEIKYQTGISQPSGTEIDPTVHPLIKAIPTSIDATTNKYLNWNGSAYVKKQVAYSEVSGTPTLADVATSGDYNDLDNLPTPYTDADARAAISLTTTGTSGAATYDDSTGVLNIPQYSGGGAETDPLSVHLTGTSTATGDMTLDLGTTNELIITGNQNAANILTVNNTNAGSTAIGISASVSGGSNAVKAVSTGGQAISGTGATGVIGTGTSFGCYGSSTSGTSLYGFTSSGTALMGFASSSGTPCKLSASPSSTNTVASLLHIIRTSSGTAANGIGGSINFYNEASDAASYESANIASTWTDVTAASRTGDLKIYTTNSATSGLRMTITGAGRVIIASIPTYADNAAAVSAGEATGTLYYRTGHGLDIVT